MYKITYSKQAAKALRKAQPHVARRITDRMEQIAEDPFADDNNITAMTDREKTYRLRSGDWRVVYEVNAGELVIWVVKVASRQEVYKR